VGILGVAKCEKRVGRHSLAVATQREEEDENEGEDAGADAEEVEETEAQPKKANGVDEAAAGGSYTEDVRQLVTDDRLTVTDLSIINVELSCPICLGIIRNAMTVMECTHRFCEACITKCLRLGKKECPSCRVKCVSRRSLRRDPNFDQIVRKVYPRLEEYEVRAWLSNERASTRFFLLRCTISRFIDPLSCLHPSSRRSKTP